MPKDLPLSAYSDLSLAGLVFFLCLIALGDILVSSNAFFSLNEPRHILGLSGETLTWLAAIAIALPCILFVLYKGPGSGQKGNPTDIIFFAAHSLLACAIVGVAIAELAYTDPTADPCKDSPSYWEDTLEQTCSDYEKNNLCTETGAFGKNFPSNNLNFDSLAVNAIAADDACCACGGGDRTNDPALAQSFGKTLATSAIAAVFAIYGFVTAFNPSKGRESLRFVGLWFALLLINSYLDSLIVASFEHHITRRGHYVFGLDSTSATIIVALVSAVFLYALLAALFTRNFVAGELSMVHFVVAAGLLFFNIWQCSWAGANSAPLYASIRAIVFVILFIVMLAHHIMNSPAAEYRGQTFKDAKGYYNTEYFQLTQKTNEFVF